jgi:hypothetical protein
MQTIRMNRRAYIELMYRVRNGNWNPNKRVIRVPFIPFPDMNVNSTSPESLPNDFLMEYATFLRTAQGWTPYFTPEIVDSQGENSSNNNADEKHSPTLSSH